MAAKNLSAILGPVRKFLGVGAGGPRRSWHYIADRNPRLSYAPGSAADAHHYIGIFVPVVEGAAFQPPP